MDQTFELPVMQVLNALAYLKARKAHEEQITKQWQQR